jgi:predicted CXXCH cytochrome family protein
MKRSTDVISGLCFVVVLSAFAQAAEHPVPLGKNPDPATCLECHSDKSKGKHVHSAIAMGCTTCHSVTSAKGVTLISLVSPANELCFTCHEKSSDKVLHGPYAEGECVACHSPHASNYPDQLLTGRQDLCLGCHARARLKVNRRQDTVTTPWGVTLTFTQMQGWQYLNLNKTLTGNHPVEGHPVTGPNTALGKGSPEITCLSCHEPHHSKNPNLMPPNVKNQTALCETCHKF